MTLSGRTIEPVGKYCVYLQLFRQHYFFIVVHCGTVVFFKLTTTLPVLCNLLNIPINYTPSRMAQSLLVYPFVWSILPYLCWSTLKYSPPSSLSSFLHSVFCLPPTPGFNWAFITISPTVCFSQARWLERRSVHWILFFQNTDASAAPKNLCYNIDWWVCHFTDVIQL